LPSCSSVNVARGTFVAARLVNVVLGVWLVISAFAWPHSHAQRTNAWILGVLCVAFELTALVEPPARYLSTVLGAWLVLSAWALPTSSLWTLWNSALVGIAIFFVSLAPPRGWVR
jgi:hypothetical protein